jgi:hypothetical protein
MWGIPKTVIERTLKPADIMEMMIYDRIEPWAHNYEWYKPAIVSAMIANANRDPKKKSRPYEPDDFVPNWVKQKQRGKTDLNSKVELMRAYVMMHNAKIEKLKGNKQ